MKTLLIALAPIGAIVTFCLAILAYNVTHKLYLDVGAGNIAADILAMWTAMLVVFTGGGLFIYHIFKEKKS